MRIVFDCSAKQGKNGVSLNDCLWTGPHITSDLVKILLRFRTNAFACISDIEKAFLMVQLREEDRNYTRFLWFSDPKDPNSTLCIYRFRVVLFGATCSPFLLNATIRKHLSLLDGNMESLKKGLYVDNLQSTCDNEDELINFFFEANKIFAQAHLYLKEWVSNSDKLQTLARAYKLHSEKDKVNKVLGLDWNIVTDTLSLHRKILTTGSTKREILRSVAQIYDPLGVLLPVTIRARMFLQDLWKEKLGSDEKVDSELQKQWDLIFADLGNCVNITIKRNIRRDRNDSLHIFCDASGAAYGCVAYRVADGKSELLMAKARVAPLKPLTIPKLELLALLLAARLAKFIRETFDVLEFYDIFIWSDSKVALSWIVSDKALPVFIKNRIVEIHCLVPKAIFSYVKSSDNPSDMLSRGTTPEVLCNTSLWWEGPSWLLTKPWPLDESWSVSESETGELEPVVVNRIEASSDRLISWEKFSTSRRFYSTMGWILRFISNCRRPASERNFGSISVEELQVATRKVLMCLQKEYFSEEYSALVAKRNMKLPLIQQLNLYLDHDLIRCKGRLELAGISENAKFPILISRKCPFASVLVRETHARVGHMGLNATTAELRQNYWIPQVKQLVKRVLHYCVSCKRVQGKPFQANALPSLPEYRVERNEPFRVTGIDYTGALWTKGSDRNEKAYIILFTCPVTRAVHLEIVTNQSCNSFLVAFRKFCGRRGFPSLVLSDNATTFVAASDYLKSMYDDSRVHEHLAKSSCKWEFIPARAPWFGAIWERLIGLLKGCLKKVLGQALLTLEELSCVLIEMESILNDRPLSFVPADFNQFEILTPNHLLCGRKLRKFPEGTIKWDEFNEDPDYLTSTFMRKRYLYISDLCDKLWKRWEREYLLALREVHRTGNKHNKWPEIGDVVLIYDEGPRNRWRLGQVSKLHFGQDGIPRVASLETAQGQLTRPLVKLYPLEISGEVKENPEDVTVNNTDTGTRPKRKTAQVAAENRRDLIQAGLL